MSTRYGDTDYDREEENYGRRRQSEYGRSYGAQSQRRYRYDDSERENQKYGRENRFAGESGRFSSSRGRDYETGREGYGGSTLERGQSSRDYGRYPNQPYGSYEDEGRYGESSSGYLQRYNYPSGFRSTQRYGEGARLGSGYESERGRYSRGDERNEYERAGYGPGEERGWWERASDTVASWFGDEEAERRRRMDQQRERLRGRGPKGYRRSDERIKEDINDRLSDGYLDASNVEVTVQEAEVILVGTVDSRYDKRHAEDIAESVSGVANVENRLRVKQPGAEADTGTTGTTDTAGTSSSATTESIGRGRSAGS